MELASHLSAIEAEHGRWKEFGRFILNLRIEELRKQFGDKAKGQLEVPDYIPFRARGILHSIAHAGSGEVVSFRIYPRVVTIYGPRQGESIGIHREKDENSGRLLSLSGEMRNIYMKDSDDFDEFRVAADIINCISHNLAVEV